MPEYEERLDEWSFIAIPSQEGLDDVEKESPAGRGSRDVTSPRKGKMTEGQVSDVDSTDRHSSQEIGLQAARESHRQRSNDPDLQPCLSCSSYHYIPDCIYLLSWTDWLDYHSTYMPSQPYPLATEAFPMEDLELQNLRNRAQQLDELPCNARPNYISNTRLKADLMTSSLAGMYYEDEEWDLRLRRMSRMQRKERSYATQSLEEQQRLVWLADMGEQEDDDDDDWNADRDARNATQTPIDWEEEADALSRLRADLGRHLPRTSTTALFKQRD